MKDIKFKLGDILVVTKGFKRGLKEKTTSYSDGMYWLHNHEWFKEEDLALYIPPLPWYKKILCGSHCDCLRGI